MRVLSTTEEQRIPHNQIIAAPIRYVGKAKQSGDMMQPKSSIRIPGHLDPQIGIYLTDAPSTPWFAVHVAATLVASLGVSGDTCLTSVQPFCQECHSKDRLMSDL